jgi:hypothetical protein
MDDVRKALEIGRDYVAEWVKNDRGIEACDIGFRTDLETIEAALAAITPASDGRAEGLREAAEICDNHAAKAKAQGRGDFIAHEIDRDAILARAAELEKADE